MEQLTILVVDDNHINRLYLKTILTQWQHHVIEVEDGYSAIEACQQQTFDWILMDIRMQPMDGITAAKKITQLPDYLNVPITAVSAERIDCQDNQYFDQCLMKPISKQDLHAILLEIVQSNDQLKPQIFDEQQALAVSHQDREIVAHLRHLLVAELPQQLAYIKQLQHRQEWEQLDQQIHRLLGSARVCAAVNLEQSIHQYRHCLADPERSNINRQFEVLQENTNALLDYVNSQR